MLLISLGVVIGTGAHLLSGPSIRARAPRSPSRKRSAPSPPRSTAAAEQRLRAGGRARARQGVALRSPRPARAPPGGRGAHPSLRRCHVEQAGVARLGEPTRDWPPRALVEEASPEAIADECVRSRMERIAALCTAHAELIRSRDEGVAAARPRDRELFARRDGAPPRASSGAADARSGRSRGRPSRPRSRRHRRSSRWRRPSDRSPRRSPSSATRAGGSELFERVAARRTMSRSSSRPCVQPLQYDRPRVRTEGRPRAAMAQAAALGLGMSNPAGATVTAVIVAQGTVGATLLRAVLRAAGAVIGGALAIATMVLVFPNTDSRFAPVPRRRRGVLGVAALRRQRGAHGPPTRASRIGMGVRDVHVLDSFGPFDFHRPGRAARPRARHSPRHRHLHGDRLLGRTGLARAAESRLDGSRPRSSEWRRSRGGRSESPGPRSARRTGPRFGP